jgi:hypothetical protein
MFSRKFGKVSRVIVAAAGLTVATAGAAVAQDGPNQGALSLTGGLHVPSVYLFRGILQESDPELTLWPFFDAGAELYSGDGGITSVGVNLGVWNSLHSGSSGGSSPESRIHYEEDFYATLSLGFGAGTTLATTYTAYTSPNAFFNTVQEIAFKVTNEHMLAPYGLVAFELDGQADGGASKGTYLELGVGPSWPLGGGATLGVPVKVGLSLNDYYEGAEGDEAFGYFDVGGLVTVPVGPETGRFGAWSVHGGANVVTLGDTTKAINHGDRIRVVGQGGITVSY